MNITKEQIKEWLDDRVADTGDFEWLLNLVFDCIQDLAPKWVSAKDKIPFDINNILMVTNKGDIHSGRGVVFNKKLKPRDIGGGFVSDYYTHWMPLPLPPK